MQVGPPDLHPLQTGGIIGDYAGRFRHFHLAKEKRFLPRLWAFGSGDIMGSIQDRGSTPQSPPVMLVVGPNTCGPVNEGEWPHIRVVINTNHGVDTFEVAAPVTECVFIHAKTPEIGNAQW